MVTVLDVLYVCFIVLCVVGSHGKPALPNFDFSKTGLFSGFSRQNNQQKVKDFSGFRLRNDSLRMVYFHDQTVAVVELGSRKLLLNCELIEIK